MWFNKKIPISKVSEFSILRYTLDRNLGKFYFAQIFGSIWNSKSKKWSKTKNINDVVWEEKMSRFPSFRICPILEIENVETSETFRLLQIFIASVARLKFFTESQINVSRRPGRKLGNLGILFPTLSLPTFRFWPNTENRKLGRRKLGKKIPSFPTFPSFRFNTF